MGGKSLMWIIALVVIVAAGVWFVNEQNKSPLEKAAEDVSDAAEEIADELGN